MQLFYGHSKFAITRARWKDRSVFLFILIFLQMLYSSMGTANFTPSLARWKDKNVFLFFYFLFLQMLYGNRKVAITRARWKDRCFVLNFFVIFSFFPLEKSFMKCYYDTFVLSRMTHVS